MCFEWNFSEFISFVSKVLFPQLYISGSLAYPHKRIIMVDLNIITQSHDACLH